MPYISIIIPCYNSEKTIIQTVNSILSQSLKDFEILIVNAGTDNTNNLVSKISDNRIKIFNVEHKGTVFSYIQGIKNAASKYITFCDSDDTYEGDFLINAFNDIEKYDCDFVSYPYKIYHDKKNIIETKYNVLPEGLYTDVLNDKKIYNNIVFNSFKINEMFLIPMCRWNKIYKKEMLLKVISKLDDSCIQLEDNIFVLYVYFNSNSFYVNNHNISYKYIKYESSVSNGCVYNGLLDLYLYSLEKIKQLLKEEKYTGNFNQLDFLAFDNLRIVYRRIAKSCSYQIVKPTLKQITKNEYYKKIKLRDLKELKNIIFFLLSKIKFNYFLYLIFKYA